MRRLSPFLPAKGGRAWATLTLASGDFRLLVCETAELEAQLERLRPAEVLVPEELPLPPVLETGRAPLRRLPGWQFDATIARRLLTAHFGVQDLAAFGVEVAHEPALAAAAALFEYVRQTQKERARPRAHAAPRARRRLSVARRRHAPQPLGMGGLYHA